MRVRICRVGAVVSLFGVGVTVAIHVWVLVVRAAVTVHIRVTHVPCAVAVHVGLGGVREGRAVVILVRNTVAVCVGTGGVVPRHRARCSGDDLTSLLPIHTQLVRTHGNLNRDV